MRRSRAPFPSLFATALSMTALSACSGDSDDPSSPDQPDITEQEAVAMLGALQEVGPFGFPDLEFGAAASSSQLAASTVPFSFTFDQTDSCPGGGTTRIRGTADGEADDRGDISTLVVEAELVHQSCRGTDEASGMSFTFDGAPDVATRFDLEADSDQATVTGNQSGAIEWRMGDRTGTCQVVVDTEIFIGLSDNQFRSSVVGTVCGFSVENSSSVG